MVHLLRTGDDSTASPTCGFVVSKAVGGSVVRHSVVRKLRHLMAERLDRLPPGSQLVVRAFPTAATASSAALGVALDRSLRGLLAGPEGFHRHERSRHA
jgi:ribonuclease P protein component